MQQRDLYAGTGGNGGNAYGGSLYNASSGSVAVTNCTFASGVVIGGTNGINGTGPYNNGSGSMGSGFGANIANASGIFKLKNSILDWPTNANNSYTSGTITDQNNNISSDATPTFSQPNSFTKTDPKLAVAGLFPNGGPTETIALMKTSPAINAIHDSSAPSFDQRGVPRPLGLRPCIGAFEFGITYSISGRVAIGSSSSPLTGVIVQANSLSTVTDVNGDYAFSNLLSGSYVITPLATPTNTPAGLFNPTNSTQNITTNVTGVNFTASTNTLAVISRGTTNKTSFQLSFLGIPNVTYLIQSSTNLTSRTNWVTLGTTNFTNGSYILTVTNSTTNVPQQRFYRAVAQ